MFSKISFNNFRCKFGQKLNGVQKGGDVILHHMKDKTSKHIINTININNMKDYKKGYNIVSHNLKNNIFNFNLGGDHSIAVSTIRPLVDRYNKDLLVIWIDAHADINTFISSKTQNMHGMPVSSLMGIMNHWYEPTEKINNKLSKKNLMYVGIRDLDKFEEDLLLQKKFIYYKNYTNNIIDTINNHPAKYIHISCDIDSLDPILTPSTGTPVSNGLLLNDVTSIIECSKKRLVGFDLVEFNPLIGNQIEVDTTLKNIKQIVNTVMKTTTD